MHWFRRHDRGRPPHPDVLTPAEWRVLEHLREGLTNAEIAARLGVSVNTVRTHVSSMLAKTGLADREALARWQGTPAPASRLALARERSPLLAPLAWLRAHARTAGIGAGVALGAAALITFAAAMPRALSNGGGEATATPAPSSTPTPEPVRAVDAPDWLTRAGFPVTVPVEELDFVGGDVEATPRANSHPPAQSTIVAVNADTGEWQDLRVPQPISGGTGGAVRRFVLVGDSLDPSSTAVFDLESGELTPISPAWGGSISPHGRWAAVIPEVEGSTLQVVDLVTGERHELGEFGKPVYLSWSEQGSLAVVRGGTLYLAQAPDWVPHAVGAMSGQRLRWSPDGSQIAFFRPDGLYVSDPALRAPRRVVTMPPFTPGSDPTNAPVNQSAAWSPDGSQIAYTADSTVHVVNVASGASAIIAPEGAVGSLSSPHHLLAWSPSGDRVAFTTTGDERPAIAVAYADGSGAYVLTHDVVGQLVGWTDRGVLIIVGLFV